MQNIQDETQDDLIEIYDKNVKKTCEIDDKIIPEFDARLLNKNYFRMSLLGSSYSGKSWFIKSIYPTIRKKYNKIFIFTPKFNEEFYEEFVHDIIGKNNKIKLNTYKFYTNNFDEAMQSVEIIRESKNADENILIIFDDLISNKSSKNDSFLRLFASGRHNRISVIYSVQFFTHEYSNNALRANSNVIVCTCPATISSRIWVKKNILEECIIRQYPKADNKKIYQLIDDKYAYLFNKKYDKCISFEGKLYKCSEK